MASRWTFCPGLWLRMIGSAGLKKLQPKVGDAVGVAMERNAHVYDVTGARDSRRDEWEETTPNTPLWRWGQR